MTLKESKEYIGTELKYGLEKNAIFSKLKRVREITKDDNDKMIVAELENGLVCNIVLLKDKDNEYIHKKAKSEMG